MPVVEASDGVLLDGRRFLSRPILQSRYDISPTTLWRWPRENGFPKPVRIGGKNMWLADEVEAWERERIEAR